MVLGGRNLFSYHIAALAILIEVNFSGSSATPQVCGTFGSSLRISTDALVSSERSLFTGCSETGLAEIDDDLREADF